PWSDGFFLSADDHLGGAPDFSISPTFSQTASLAAATSYTVPPTGTVTITLPQVPAGSYFLLLQTDRAGQVPEANETNNVLATPIQVLAPDLVPTNITAPATGNAGKTIAVSFAVSNQGTGQAFQPWVDAFSLSADDHFGGAPDFSITPTFSRTTSVPAGTGYTVPSSGTV